MPFPSPSITPPTLALYQMSYREQTLGGISTATNDQLVKLTKGREPAPVLSGDVQRPLDEGEFAGLDLLGGKDVELEHVIRATTAAAYDEAVQEIDRVLTISGSTEEPLYLKLTAGTFACMGRPRKHAPITAGIDVTTVIGRAGAWATLLHCTDPRWYAVPTKTATVSLPAPITTGLTFPASAPFEFGGGSAGGILEVLNSGTIEMRPILIFKGPCTNPVARNLSLPGEPYIGFNLTMATGDVLEVNMDYETALYTPSGSPSGSSEVSLLMENATWWNLPDKKTMEGYGSAGGVNRVQFSSSDGVAVAGTLTVQSANAFAGV